MTSAVNGLPKTLPQRSDFPWRKGAQARRTEKIVVGLCLTQFRQRNPYRRVRPIGDEKCPLVDDFGTLSIRTFLVVNEAFGMFLKFPFLKPKTTSLFMLDFIRSTGGRYMICLVWIYLDLVYQLEFIRYDIWRLCALICFSFFWFFWILCPPICILVKC